MLLPLVIVSPIHNKQDSGHIDVVRKVFLSILDLEYRVLYFSIMEKTHIEIETNIMGEECLLYMQPYNYLPSRINVTAVCLVGGLAEDHRDCTLAAPMIVHAR